MNSSKFQVRSYHVVAFVAAFVLTAFEFAVLRESSDTPRYQDPFFQQGVELAQSAAGESPASQANVG